MIITEGKTAELKRARGKCLARMCTHKAGKGKKFCHRHHNHWYAINHPASYRYTKLKQSAKKRNIPFDLELEEFKAWAIANGALNKYGRKLDKFSASIDRKNADPAKGYYGFRLDNIQVLEMGVNSAKGRKSYVPQLFQLPNGKWVYIDPNEPCPF